MTQGSTVNDGTAELQSFMKYGIFVVMLRSALEIALSEISKIIFSYTKKYTKEDYILLTADTFNRKGKVEKVMAG